MLSARYGVEGRRLKEGGRGGSVWWREFVHIRDGVGLEVGGWLEDNLPNEIDNGDNTFFLDGKVFWDLSLRDRFRRFFDLSESKWVRDADMFVLVEVREMIAWK